MKMQFVARFIGVLLVAVVSLTSGARVQLHQSLDVNDADGADSQAAVDAQRMIIDERMISCVEGEKMCYSKTDGRKGRCKNCDDKKCAYTSTFKGPYRLERDRTRDKVGEVYKSSQYTLTLAGGQKIMITMPKLVQSKGGGGHLYYTNSDAQGDASKRNCFGFATHRTKGIPAGAKGPVSMPGNVTEETVQEALKIEKAIFLGREDILEQVENVNENQKYLIVAVYIKPGEYHFHGLFANGWHWTSSKISGQVFNANMGPRPIEEQCPGGSIFKGMKVRGMNYLDDQGGFYLFPCKKDKSFVC